MFLNDFFLKCVCWERKELLELNNLLSAQFSFMLWRSTELHSGVGGGGMLCQTENLLEGLLIPAGLEPPQNPNPTPPEELLEDVAGAALLSLLPSQLRAG